MLELKNISKSYGEQLILNDISFQVNEKELVSILGPSGSGKSTLVKLLLRLYEIQDGLITLDGINIQDVHLGDLRRSMGLVSQDVFLFHGTVRDNIAYGSPDVTFEQIIQASEIAEAHSFIQKLPQGYDTIVGERGQKLSGGQRQRIAIARALLKDPALLILDEATSSLDSESERLVQEALEELMKNRTSIIIAHRLSTIREADKIIVLEKGKVVESGNHSALMKNKEGLYRYLSQLQLENQEIKSE